jgi:hypothetical protein
MDPRINHHPKSATESTDSYFRDPQ